MLNWDEEPPTQIREPPLNKKNKELHYLLFPQSVSPISIVVSCPIALEMAKCKFSRTLRVKILQVFLFIPVWANCTIIIFDFITCLCHLCKLMCNQSRDLHATAWHDIHDLLHNNAAAIDWNRYWWIVTETGRLLLTVIDNTRRFTRYSKASFIGVGKVRCLLFASTMYLRCDV